MKEFSFSYFKAIAQGIRNRAGGICSDNGASSIVNMQLRETGPEPYDDVVALISTAELAANGIVVDYPFPQVFKGKGIMLLVDEDAVYEVNTTDFTLTQLTTFDAYSTQDTKAITADGVWHFADFYDTWFLYNGTSVVFRTNIDAIDFMPDKTYVQESVTIGTGIDFRGRLITSGFDPANFWNEDWQFALECMKENLFNGLEADETIKNNFVWWTMIANGDTLWQFFPELALARNQSNEFSIVGSRYLEAIERNDMGFMPMPFEGAIHIIKELGGNVIVYGQNGIAALKPVSSLTPTFGLIPIQTFGIDSRAVVGGDDKQHLFIDAKGQLWKLKADLTTELLDYSEFIQPLLDDNLGITYDSNTQEFYIGSDDTSFLLGPQGLTEVHQIVTSVINENGKKGIFESTGVTTSTIVSNIITIGNNALNTFTSIEVDGLYEDGIKVAVDYRYNRSDVFTRSRFVNLNSMGWARFNFAGLEFKAVVQAPDFTNFNPSNLTIKWKSNDKRNIRGINVSQAST